MASRGDAIGAGADGVLPVVQQIRDEADRVDVVALATAEAMLSPLVNRRVMTMLMPDAQLHTVRGGGHPILLGGTRQAEPGDYQLPPGG